MCVLFTLTDRASTIYPVICYVVVNPVRGLLDREKIIRTPTKLQREHINKKTRQKKGAKKKKEICIYENKKENATKDSTNRY